MHSVVRTIFDEVKLYAAKSGACGCGKYRRRTRKFYQTINPFNKIEGRPKTRKEIYAELTEEANAWKREPITCDNCGPKEAA